MKSLPTCAMPGPCRSGNNIRAVKTNAHLYSLCLTHSLYCSMMECLNGKVLNNTELNYNSHRYRPIKLLWRYNLRSIRNSYDIAIQYLISVSSCSQKGRARFRNMYHEMMHFDAISHQSTIIHMNTTFSNAFNTKYETDYQLLLFNQAAISCNWLLALRSNGTL